MSVLLDTHILIWWQTEPARLSRAQAHVLRECEGRGSQMAISAISLREIAVLVRRRRYELPVPLDVWIEETEQNPLLRILPLTGRIAAESVRLGDDFPKDPADQIIVATARCHGLRLVTADERLRRWGRVPLV